MTSEELQSQLNETWGRSQSADDSHYAIWGEPFAGETVRISDIAAIIEKPDYTNPEEIVRRLREILKANNEIRSGIPSPASKVFPPT